jgi:hypothetical protein
MRAARTCGWAAENSGENCVMTGRDCPCRSSPARMLPAGDEGSGRAARWSLLMTDSKRPRHCDRAQLHRLPACGFASDAFDSAHPGMLADALTGLPSHLGNPKRARATSGCSSQGRGWATPTAGERAKVSPPGFETHAQRCGETPILFGASLRHGLATRRHARRLERNQGRGLLFHGSAGRPANRTARLGLTHPDSVPNRFETGASTVEIGWHRFNCRLRHCRFSRRLREESCCVPISLADVKRLVRVADVEDVSMAVRHGVGIAVDREGS